jgi:hypothetical protein
MINIDIGVTEPKNQHEHNSAVSCQLNIQCGQEMFSANLHRLVAERAGFIS